MSAVILNNGDVSQGQANVFYIVKEMIMPINRKRGGIRMAKRNLSVVFMVFVFALVLAGCAGKIEKYENAKRQAEAKLSELEEILKPAKALEKGDLSALQNIDIERYKRISEKAKDPRKMQALADEISSALQKAAELKPEGFQSDYDQWAQKIKQRMGALQ